MRRRKQKNTLLPKMIVLAVVVNAILLPLLSQLGILKVGKTRRDLEVKLVKLPPAPKKATPPKPKRRTAKPRPATRKVATKPSATPKANPNQPKLVAAAPAPGDNGSGGDIVNNGTGQTGQVTAPTNPTTPTKTQDTTPTPQPTPTPTPQTAPTPPKPEPTPPPAPKPHVPELTAARPLSQPKPSIPDELRDANLNATFRALFTVHADGSADVKMTSSTGNSTLDQLALDAARQWTFQPATEDGQPVESYLRLAVEFEVS